MATQAASRLPDDDTPYAAWRFQKDLPEDRTLYKPSWKLLEDYSKIPANEIDAHVVEIRNRAFKIFNYPCLGRFRFLDLYILSSPLYPSIVSRLKSGQKFLDVGCCFGHILRQLAFDGVPSENLAGTDLRPEFISLGYSLFRDRTTFQGQMIAGDILASSGGGLDSLDRQFDIIHAASFFHLFNWNDQVRIGVRIVKFLREGQRDALILGRQLGERNPLSPDEYRRDGARKAHHDVKSFQALWDEIGDKTGTRWKVEGTLNDADFEDLKRTVIRFAVHRVS